MENSKPGNNARRSTRSKKGQLIVEQMSAVFLLVPILTLFLGLVDASLIIVCSSVNEGISRDATRLAAVGPATEYQNRVAGYLSSRQKEFAEGLMRNVQVDKDNTGIDIKSTKKLGTVSVTTSMDIYPVFVLGGFLSATQKVPYFRVSSQHTFPLSDPGSIR
jgi:hypothetical protein